MLFACGMCGGTLELGALTLAGAFGVIMPYLHDKVILAARRAERAALATLPREQPGAQPGGPLAAREATRLVGREATRLAIIERTAS